MIKLSLVIPTINRYEYLEPFLISLNKTIKPKDIFIELTFIDDASDDKRVIDYITQYECKFSDKINKIYKNIRTPGLCETNLKKIWSKNYNEGFNLFCNLDPDILFNRNWLIKLLELYSQFGSTGIYTPFNTASHPISKKFNTYCIKNSIGGICMLFDREIYKKVIEPCLFPSSAWDWEVCKKIKGNGTFYCTIPSYIEHIGKNSSARDSNKIPLFDRAIDFIGE